jgi:hypothetical protein
MKAGMLLPLVLLASLARAEGGAPDHARVAVASRTVGDKLELSFKVVPEAGLHVNMEGPWKLELKRHDGLAFAKTTFAKSDMQEKVPGFVATTSAKPSQAKGDVEYSLVAFVCTDDKTQCFREVHSGKAAWSTAAK